MRYLNCTEMLNYALKTLKKDSRQSVPVGKMAELFAVMTNLRDMLMDEQITNPIVMLRMNDLLSAILTVQKNTVGMECITDTMKQELISGVESMKYEICSEAVNYYKKTDFEETPEVVAGMRDIVECYLENGGVL